MEEETERLKEEDERCDAGDMQLLTSSPRPGEVVVRLNADYVIWDASAVCS